MKQKNNKKIFLSLLAATTIFTAQVPSYANNITVTMPHIIYETSNSENLSSGVVHENIRKFTNNGWLNINVIRIDMDNQYTELKGLFNSEGIPNRGKVSTLVEKSGAVAAVNGDYFNYQPLPSAMGTLINDGEIISSPIELGWALPTFYLTERNTAGIEYLDRKMVATNTTKGITTIINTVNKVTKEFDTITLLNKHWGSKSIGSRFNNDLTEVLITDGVVQAKRTGGDPFEITENSYVLAIRNNMLDNYEAGDLVNLELNTVPDVEQIKFAIGGGSIILKDGQLSLTNINSKGNEPRTGIGVNQNNSELILVTIDGRDTSFKGVSQELFGAIMRELGAYQALNLDGGGSTTMAVKAKDQDKVTVVNKPSDGGERSVVNAVGVFSNAPKGELSYFKLSTDDNKMFVDTNRNITVRGYDEHHNPVEFESSMLSFSTEGIEGSFTGNTFRASSAGKGKVIAHYNGVESSMDIEVLDEIRDITTSTTSLNLDINGQFKLGNFEGKDKNGVKAKIHLEDILFNVVGGIGEIRDGVFYSSSQPSAGAISVIAGKGIENIMVSVGSVGQQINGFEALNGFNFSGYPRDIVTGSVALSSEAHEGSKSIALNYDFSKGENTRAAYLNLISDNSDGILLSGSPKKIDLWVKGDGSGVWMRAALKDAKGVEHIVDLAKTVDFTDWRNLTAVIPDGISYPIKLQRIYVAETNSAKKPSGQILIDGLSAHYPTKIDENLAIPTATKLVDELEIKKEADFNALTFAISGEPKGLNEILGYDAAATLKNRISQNKIGIVLNGVTPEFSSGISSQSVINAGNSYSITKNNNIAFISVNSSQKGIRPTDYNQWTRLMNDLNISTENNIVLLLSTPVFGSAGFTDKLEAELLHDVLVQAKQSGKNIFVVHGGSSTKSDLIDGIRYLQLNTGQISKMDDVYNISMIEFILNGEDISYSINKVFNK